MKRLLLILSTALVVMLGLPAAAQADDALGVLELRFDAPVHPPVYLLKVDDGERYLAVDGPEGLVVLPLLVHPDLAANIDFCLDEAAAEKGVFLRLTASGDLSLCLEKPRPEKSPSASLEHAEKNDYDGIRIASGISIYYNYDAYGNARARTPLDNLEFPNRYRFPSREYDAHRHDYDLRMLTFVPEWLSEDPMGYMDGLNLYAAYMGVEGRDPTGAGVVEWLGQKLLELDEIRNQRQFKQLQIAQEAGATMRPRSATINFCEYDIPTSAASAYQWLTNDTSITVFGSGPPNWAEITEKLKKGGGNYSIIYFAGHHNYGGAGSLSESKYNTTDDKKDTESIAQRNFLRSLREVMESDGKIVINACLVAESDESREGIVAMSQLTNTEITAWTDWYAVRPHGFQYAAKPDGTVSFVQSTGSRFGKDTSDIMTVEAASGARIRHEMDLSLFSILFGALNGGATKDDKKNQLNKFTGSYTPVEGGKFPPSNYQEIYKYPNALKVWSEE